MQRDDMKRRSFISLLFAAAGLTALPSLGASALDYRWLTLTVNGVVYKMPIFDS